MARFLITGIATLDIINQVDHFPQEDEEMRAKGQIVTRGGNAANSASVLVQYGHQVQFMGVLAGDAHGQLIAEDLTQRGIVISDCPVIADGIAPTSYITLNQQNGSRTIVHYRDLPELNAENFRVLHTLREFDWFHFEGRVPDELIGMLEQVKQVRVDQPISIEIEKERPKVDALFDQADVLIFSKAFIRGRGFNAAEPFMRDIRQTSQAILIAAWGDEGAFALQGENLFHAPAYPPAAIVDTIGAGDTFNAALLHQLATGQTLAKALDEACRLAGKKIGQTGFDQLL